LQKKKEGRWPKQESFSKKNHKEKKFHRAQEKKSVKIQEKKTSGQEAKKRLLSFTQNKREAKRLLNFTQNKRASDEPSVQPAMRPLQTAMTLCPTYRVDRDKRQRESWLRLVAYNTAQLFVGFLVRTCNE